VIAGKVFKHYEIAGSADSAIRTLALYPILPWSRGALTLAAVVGCLSNGATIYSFFYSRLTFFMHKTYPNPGD
jgi:hypothetical protein